MSLRRWTVEHLRAVIQIARARPDYLTGLRAAAACVLPLLFGELHGDPRFVWMALGGWLGTLADSGGAYRVRALSQAGFALGATLAALLGGLAAGQLWLAAPLLLVTAVAAGVIRALGEATTTVATLVLIALCISLGTPADLAGALTRAAMMAAGCAGAAALSLGLWPVHPYGPGREAVGG